MRIPFAGRSGPPPEIETAPEDEAGAAEKGNHRSNADTLPTKPKARRQQLSDRTEQLFTLAPSGHYHADSSVRRRKTREELIEGHETVKLFDRAHPDQLAGRRKT